MAATALRNSFADTIVRVAYQGERVVIERNGKAVAGLVSADDMQLLEELENGMDLKAARAALRDRSRTPWREAKKALGL